VAAQIGVLKFMENRLGLVITFAVVAGSAALVAFTLGYVAHYEIGLSRIEIQPDECLLWGQKLFWRKSNYLAQI
jgi:hypothetical protein